MHKSFGWHPLFRLLFNNVFSQRFDLAKSYKNENEYHAVVLLNKNTKQISFRIEEAKWLDCLILSLLLDVSKVKQYFLEFMNHNMF